MKHALFLKFILLYFLLAMLGIFINSALGSQLIEDHLVRGRASDLYSELSSYSTDYPEELLGEASPLNDVYLALKAMAAGDGGDIRIIDTKGNVILNTAAALDPDHPHTITGFDYTKTGPKYYMVSTFFGEYQERQLNVIVPILTGVSIDGYIACSIPYSLLTKYRDILLNDMYIVVIVNFLLSLTVLAVMVFTVYRPLGRITEGARQFASGNLSHKIEVRSSDEIGYLSDTLNFMAGELKKNNDYQKKFISNISHDLRSPLTSIKGFSEAMIDGTIPPELHARYLEIISGETDRLVNLTKSVLTLNSNDQDKVILHEEAFDINEMLRTTAAVFEGSCRKKLIMIRLVLEDGIPRVYADRERIEQVVYNLLDNAIKFSDKGGEIKLETSMKHGKCHVSVKDHGCGIPSASLSSIWDRFYKADPSRGKDRTGTGLGLSIAREIIKAHGQTISVVSTEGVGTEFTFTLPLNKNGQKNAVQA